MPPGQSHEDVRNAVILSSAPFRPRPPKKLSFSGEEIALLRILLINTPEQLINPVMAECLCRITAHLKVCFPTFVHPLFLADVIVKTKTTWSPAAWARASELNPNSGKLEDAMRYK